MSPRSQSGIFIPCLFSSPCIETIFAVILCVLCASAVNVRAADWSFTPSATLSEAYDSNFRFIATPLPGTSKSDYITSFTPVVSINGETEQTKFNFDSTTSAQAYINNPKYDIINTDTVSGLTQNWSPRFSTTATFGLMHDQTIEQQLEVSGIVTLRTERYVYNSGLSSTYALNEAWNLNSSFSYSQTVYPSGSLQNNDVYQGTVTPTWSIDDRNTIGLTSNFSYTDYSAAKSATGAGTTVETLTEMLTLQRNFSETMNCKLGGGYYFSSIDFTGLVPELFELIPGFPIFGFGTKLVPKRQTVMDNGLVFSADLNKDWTERFSTTFSAGRQQYNAASAQAFASTFVSGTASYKWSELTTVSFTARYNTNDQISQGTGNIDYFVLSPSIQTNLTENLILRLSGSYEHESETTGSVGSTKSNLERYRTWVDLTYKWPRFLANH
jgi:hypothetical protein